VRERRVLGDVTQARPRKTEFAEGFEGCFRKLNAPGVEFLLAQRFRSLRHPVRRPCRLLRHCSPLRAPHPAALEASAGRYEMSFSPQSSSAAAVKFVLTNVKT